MKKIIEARLVSPYKEGSQEHRNPYAQVDEHGTVIGGEYRVGAGREADFDPTLRFDKWCRLPENGGKRLAGYLKKIPWVELRIRPEIDDADDLGILDGIPEITAEAYQNEQASQKNRQPHPRSGEKIIPSSFIPPNHSTKPKGR